MEYLKSAIPNYKCIFFPVKKNMRVSGSPLPSHLWSQNLQVWGQEPVFSPCPVLQATSVSSVWQEERLLAEDLKKGRCGTFEHSAGWHVPVACSEAFRQRPGPDGPSLPHSTSRVLLLLAVDPVKLGEHLPPWKRISQHWSIKQRHVFYWAI